MTATARPAQSRRGDGGAGIVIHALRVALHAALYPRADGSRHDRNCREARVNSVRYACSDACEYATGALLLAEDWEDGLEIVAPAPTQPALFDEVAG